MLQRHPPECFVDGQHVDLNGRKCTRQDEILIDGRGWVPNTFSDCNISDFDGWCYVHKNYDCNGMFWIWYREITDGTDDPGPTPRDPR